MKHDLMAANVALTRKHWAKNFIKTCRALGMTDAEIKDALLKTQAAGESFSSDSPAPDAARLADVPNVQADRP